MDLDCAWSDDDDDDNPVADGACEGGFDPASAPQATEPPVLATMPKLQEKMAALAVGNGKKEEGEDGEDAGPAGEVILAEALAESARRPAI
jgi:hypothetical protein